MKQESSLNEQLGEMEIRDGTLKVYGASLAVGVGLDIALILGARALHIREPSEVLSSLASFSWIPLSLATARFILWRFYQPSPQRKRLTSEVTRAFVGALEDSWLNPARLNS